MNVLDMLERLQLPTKNPNAEHLDTLTRWCHDHVSRDITFTGNIQDQYNQYAQLAAKYETFKETVTGHITEEMAALGHMNSIQYAAAQGYDKYIDQLAVDDPMAFDQAMTSSKITALHLAARHGHLYTVMSLLEKGANPTLKDKNDDYPVMHSLKLSIQSRDRVRREHIFHLLKDIPRLEFYTNASGNTLAHIMAQNGFTSLLDETLKEYPDATSQVNEEGMYPINLAIRNANETRDVQLLLLTQTPSILALSNQHGDLPLHDASRYIEDATLTQAYIRAHLHAGLSVDSTNTRDETPLMLAAQGKNRPMIEALLAHGADPAYLNRSGKNILDYAYQSPEDKGFCEWILQKAPALNPHQLDELISLDLKFKF